MTNESRPERVLVDPKTAAGWLAGVPADYVAARLNRSMTAQLIEVMRNGEWKDDMGTTDVIYLDEDGVALTGLMRLMAVLLANVRVWMYVQRDVRRADLSLIYSGDSQPDLKDFAHARPNDRF